MASSARALNAILPQIPTAPYEAHQKARTFAARYTKSAQYDTAIDVLFQSARELFKVGQTGSGVDLTGYMLDVYEAKGEVVGETSRARLTQLIALAGSQGAWRKTIVDKAIAWSAKHGPCPTGDPDLQHYVGELYFKDGMYEAAEGHLLKAGNRDSARLLAKMFTQWYAGSLSYVGAFTLRGTIPYLQNGNILAARTFIAYFVAALPAELLPLTTPTLTLADDEVKLTSDPAVNFAQLAVLTCQRAQGSKNKIMRESWVRLCGTYQSQGGVLASPEVRVALNELSTLYFAIPPPKGQNANPLGDLMSSLFGAPAPHRVLSPPVTAPGLD